MSNVPNELKITINTNIPGFQTIRYKPYMTLTSDKNDGFVQFNPLVKLNPSIIKSLPVDVQIKEFFNKGLFQSLINSHGLLREKTLVEATKNGYVDNNIRVTLDTLFPSNSVIYINKEPYVIADIQWRKGDWKIDKKIHQAPQVERSRIKEPHLYQTVVKDEVISGENELYQIPNDIIYGPNYTGSQNVASGVNRLEKPENYEKKFEIADGENETNIDPESTHEIKLNVSRKSSSSLRSYFKDKDYYFMLNTIFKNMNENEKSVVDKIFKETSGVDVKSSNNLSVKAYNITTDNIRVNQNTGAGDCFFIAVADAINYYNSNVNSTADKIIYNNYGKGDMIYTQKMLRELVSYYILHMSTINFSELSNILGYNVSLLNDKFAQQYTDYKKNVLHNNIITPNIFFDIVNNIYHSDDNFLIMKPTKMTKETLQKPFRIVEKSEIKTYIENSDYWANSVAIDALCEILGLNIITIESVENKLRIPYIYNNTKPWSKYMFLYHENNHYELISFDYIFKTFRKEPSFSIKTNNVRTTIFDKLGNIFPPFNIIFLIFATNYINIKDQKDKNKFQLLSPILQIIFNIFNDIEKNKSNEDNSNFLKLFNEYFTPSKSVFAPIDGGATTPYKNNQRLYDVSSDPAKSNISYYITIDMDLQKGTSLSPKDLSNLKCRKRWNSVRKSYADLRGLNYVATPDYSNRTLSSSKTSQNNKTKTQKGGLGLQRIKFNNANTNNKTKKRLYLS